jgi:ketosteroid isomerase-like protein
VTSPEHVELGYRANDAFNRRDLHAFLALMDRDIEFVPYEVSIQGGDPYRGHEGVHAWWEDTLAALPDLRVETHEIRDFGEMTFVSGRLSGKGGASGASFERALWQAVRWRDGKIVWWRAFETEDEALEAVGVRE